MNAHPLRSLEFSVAGFTFTDFRQKLSPVNLEEQLFLKVNKRFWDAKVIQELFAQRDNLSHSWPLGPIDVTICENGHYGFSVLKNKKKFH